MLPDNEAEGEERRGKSEREREREKERERSSVFRLRASLRSKAVVTPL